MTVLMNSEIRRSVALAGLLLFAAGTTSAQMTIDVVTVTSGPCALDGVHEGFFFDPFLQGSGIAGVALDTSSGQSIPMTEVEDDEFIWEDPAGDFCRRFDSLAEIDALGALTFDLLGELGELDTIVVPLADYMIGAGQPGGPVMVTPAMGDTSLPPSNNFVWASAPSWVELIQAELIDPVLDDGVDEFLFVDPFATSWTAFGVAPGNIYLFKLSFFDAYYLGDARTSAMGRSYVFNSAFQAINQKFVPEPGVGIALAVGSFGLALARRRRTRA